jgi:hypothetical protein
MSALGQSHHFDHAPITSGLTRKADKFKAGGHFAKVPNTDVGSACLKKMFTEAQRPLPLVSGGAGFTFGQNGNGPVIVPAAHSWWRPGPPSRRCP